MQHYSSQSHKPRKENAVPRNWEDERCHIQHGSRNRPDRDSERMKKRQNRQIIVYSGTRRWDYGIQINKETGFMTYGCIERMRLANLSRNCSVGAVFRPQTLGGRGWWHILNILSIFALLSSKGGFARPLNLTPRGRPCHASVGLRLRSLWRDQLMSVAHILSRLHLVRASRSTQRG